MCTACPTGKFSIIEGSTECSICPKNAQCPGKDQIWVDLGYWRNSTNSSVIEECFDAVSCPGVTSEEDDPFKLGYKCAVGQYGNLCTQCIKANVTESNGQIKEIQFQRSGSHKCAQCIEEWLNALRLAGLLLAIVLFFIVLIIVNIRTRQDSPQSILLRILTNYISVITTASSFNLSFPTSLDAIFTTVKTVGETAKVFLSLDCFMMKAEMVTTTGTTIYLKVLLTGLLPIILILFSLIFWLILKPIPWFKISWKGMLDKMVLSCIVLLFIVHPQVTNQAVELFNCYQLSGK